MGKLKKITILLFTFVMLIGMTNTCFADNMQQKKKVEVQRKQLQSKIRILKKQEWQVSNRLSKNQQKLEKNQRALKASQEQYKQKQKNITNLQGELNSYLKQYNVRQKRQLKD